MKGNHKKLLALLMSVLMAAALLVPALATDPAPADTGRGTQVQITKTLNIGQGITVPTETFQFKFTPATPEEAEVLGETGSYIAVGSTQSGTGEYPTIANLTVAYDSTKRSADGTDESLTFLSEVLDLSDSAYAWSSAGLYIYSVEELTGNTTGMTYSGDKYFLKVYIKNSGTDRVVDFVSVFGQDDQGQWVKLDGAPTDAPEPGTSSSNDGCDDFAGNEFLFTNDYRKLVTVHPTNPDPTSGDDTAQSSNPHAFKLTKGVSGNYANHAYGFDFKVLVHLPSTYSDYTPIEATVNGYTANIIENVDTYDISQLVTVTLEADREYIIYLHHGDSFDIVQLPAGATVEVEEEASGMKYVPSYTGKWGGDMSVDRSGTGAKSSGLKADTIVVGENGAYVQFTNTLNDNDVSATGIAISNLPYILMVVIALGGIGLYMASKKRRAR